MNASELRQSMGAILAAEDRRPIDWNEVDHLADSLRRKLAAEPETTWPKIVSHFLNDTHIRAKDESYASLQRERMRRFVDHGEFVDSTPIPWWGTALAVIVLCGVIVWLTR
jgi:hypothetical protein